MNFQHVGVEHHGAQITHKNFRCIYITYANPMINNRKTNARENMALPPGCQLFTVQVQVRSPGSSCSIRGGQSGTVYVFSQVLHFAPSIIIPSVSYIPASLICSTYNMPTGRHSAKDLSLTRPPELKGT